MTAPASPSSETVWQGRRRRLALPVLTLGLALGHMYTRALHWRCPVARFVHHPCPTCGVTTATKLAISGHLHAALALHPLVLVVSPFVAIIVALELGTYVWNGNLGTWSEKKEARGATVVIALALFMLWLSRFFGAFGGPVETD